MLKEPGAGGVFSHNVAVTEELVFVRREAFETHRAAGVELVGADAELGPESVSETVSESRRGVVIDARGIA